ncbi:MAG: type II toxin-antitoxin system Phd/YefM family antitoxin [Myxococcales bacterium]|nr:type II toxin-antitoxin system Phd/YefM family antitoxin [Myxococcales bacterium]
MPTLGATAFKASCLRVLERVRRTGEAVTITRRGKPIARLVAASDEHDRPPQMTLQGTVEVLSDIVGPVTPPSAWDAAVPAPPRPKRHR